MPNVQGIYRDGILLDLGISFWSCSKMLINDDFGMDKSKISVNYKLGKKLLIPEEIIREFRLIESRARRLVEENSFQFPIGNARFIPKKKFAKILDQLKIYQAEYNALTEKLIENYDKYRSEMIPIYRQAAEVAFLNQAPTGIQEFSIEAHELEKTRYVEEFLNRIASYYPPAESLRSRFSLTWDVYEIALPRMRKGDAEDMVDHENKRQIADEEYRVQTHAKIGAFIDDVVKTLRSETVELCNRVVSNITEGKVVKGRTLNSIRDFIDKFSELNFVGDVRIEEELAGLRKEFLDTHTPEQITEEMDLQDELKRRLNTLAEAATNMTDINTVTGEYRRKIAWE